MTGEAGRKKDCADDDPIRGLEINRYDLDLLGFAIKWLPYGGAPDDEILPNFGLCYEKYVDRLHDAVERHRDEIHPDTVGRLLTMCAEWRSQRRPSTTRTPRQGKT